MKVEVDIPDGKYCNSDKEECIFWDYGGSGSFSTPWCLRFKEHPEKCDIFPFESSLKLKECLQEDKVDRRKEVSSK